MLPSKWQLWVAWLLCAGPLAFLQLVLQAAGERQGMKLQVGVGSGFVDQGLWIRVCGSGFVDQGLWIRVCGSGFVDQGLWIRVKRFWPGRDYLGR
jgi:hypothetical protein